MALQDPYAQPTPGSFDPGMELGSLYQEDAANKLAKAQTAQRLNYDQGIAGHYGVTDVSAKVKGLTDTDLYNLAVNLVNSRRGAAAPKPSPTPAPAPKPTTKPATTATKTTTSKTTTKAPTTTKTTTAPKITAATTSSKTTAKTAATITAPRTKSGLIPV